MTFAKRLTTALPVAALVTLPVAGFAQSADNSDTETMAPDTQAGTEMQASSDFSDEQLDSFVDAAMDVAALRQDYAMRMNEAESDEARQTLVDEANTEMRSVIEEADGITVDEYIEIGEASAADEELNERIVTMLRDRMPEQPGGGTASPQGDG
ncbi:DUF4168 domain-containing protein [Mesobaculum littorinae]|nr:DUF4168 domain-containing protein [Mesobaculum littorinae]